MSGLVGVEVFFVTALLSSTRVEGGMPISNSLLVGVLLVLSSEELLKLFIEFRAQDMFISFMDFLEKP